MIKENTQSQPVNSAHMYERHTMTTPEIHVHVTTYVQTYYPSFISTTMIVKKQQLGGESYFQIVVLGYCPSLWESQGRKLSSKPHHINSQQY